MAKKVPTRQDSLSRTFGLLAGYGLCHILGYHKESNWVDWRFVSAISCCWLISDFFSRWYATIPPRDSSYNSVIAKKTIQLWGFLKNMVSWAAFIPCIIFFKKSIQFLENFYQIPYLGEYFFKITLCIIILALFFSDSS